jgi:putative phosphoesterase
MKITIISDVHNNTTNLKKVLNYCAKNQIKKIICCGDLASAEILKFIAKNFSGTFYYTFGNMDNAFLREFGYVKDYENTKIFTEYGEVKIDGKKIAFVHYPNVARELAATGKYEFIFYGHTHKPWTEKTKNCTILNPGNVANEIYPPTFAAWETENNNFELIRINDI